jgi:hypothetical protein
MCHEQSENEVRTTVRLLTVPDMLFNHDNTTTDYTMTNLKRSRLNVQELYTLIG